MRKDAPVVQQEKKTAKTVKSVLFTVLAIAFWIALWGVSSYAAGKAWILPSPVAVLTALWQQAKSGTLFLRVGNSLLGILSGFFAGTVFGALLAALSYRVRFVHFLFSPLLTAVRATPVASFILILWVFFARETVPAVCVGLIVLPVVWGNVEAGLHAADPKLVETAKVYRFSFTRKIRYLYLPALWPFFRTAALTALGMAWKAGVAAEVLCTPDNSIGQMIWYAKRDIETADLFAWTIAVIVVCFALEKLTGRLLALPYARKAGRG